ncbi:SDR family NAD(P)-dependent oxidoreductase [Streptomyces sp. NPDC006997]|uniref:SDR family NAD(P)-dependent oxidoreductase n=1 Tax=Streptomyces sp. NPDC006997 TaxID=3155356 RepID=UPI0034076DD0
MQPNVVAGDFRVTRQDVLDFAEAGGDASPLHLDAAYARQTPFGQPVAHGALCVLHALALTAAPTEGGRRLASLRARFLGPVYADQRYTWQAEPDGAHATVLRLLDGRRALAEIDVRYDTGAVHPAPEDGTPRAFTEAAARTPLEDLAPGTEAGTRYRPDWRALGRFTDARGLARRGVGPEHVSVLAWASQLAGMEVPGRAALVSGIDADFTADPGGPHGFTARAVLADVDPRYRSVRLTGDVTAGHTTARVEVRAFARREAAPSDPARLRALLGEAAPLRGRTALVCGGSRGLGAALVQALALAGATVHVAYRDSTAETEALLTALSPDAARVRPHRGDVGDPAWCAELSRSIRDQDGPVDLLVLNAGPPARPMDLHPDTVTRSGEHVAEALRLVQAPLAACTADLAAGGVVVAVSSAYAPAPQRGLSHYTAAKRAVEGLVTAVTVDHPGVAALVVRPPRLATTFADSMTDDTALAVEPVAAAVVHRVAAGPAAGTTEILDQFRQEPPAEPTGTSGTLAVAATFTTDPLRQPLTHWTDRLGLDLAVELTSYGQVFQELLDPGSAFAANRRGCDVVLLRAEDWPEGAEGERTADEFAAAARAAAERLAVPLLVALCPASPPAVDRRGPALRALEDRVRAALEGARGVHLVRLEDRRDGHWVTDHHDAAREEHASIPYTPQACTALATAVVRHVHALLGKPFKVLVLDCDNTLWRGVVGEDGPRGVQLGEAHRRLQEWAVRRHDEGVLICLASKNSAEDVEEVFRRRPEMPLRPEHIAARRVDWNPKPANIEALAAELGVGLDSFVFLDDNPVEVAAVRAAQPRVLALRLPWDEAEWPAFLARLWAFDRAEVTDEDRRRTALYQASRRRDEAKEAAPSLARFIEGLGLRVDVHEADDAELARFAQLTQRTNQFNLAPLRRTESDLRRLRADGARCWVAEVHDRFGDYGLVGAAVTRERDGDVLLDTFLLSCRVLGRGVEHAFLAAVARAATTADGPTHLRAEHRPTDRNAPARTFFHTAMGEPGPGQDAQVFRARLTDLAALVFQPDEGPSTEAPDTDPAPAPQRGGPVAGDAARREALALLADELTDPAALHHAVTGETAAPVPVPEARHPAGGTDDAFDAVRTVVARLRRLPVTELTPDTTLESLRLESLEIVDATVALEKTFGRLPKTLFFEHRTLGALAAALAPATAPTAPPAPVAVVRERQPAPPPAEPDPGPVDGIAVVGIAGRYPGARDTAELWENLKAGAESLSDVADRWARRDVVDPRGGPDRTYTSAGGLLDGVDEFDAPFFHLAPSEAETMDPQQRLFLQTAHHALEDAGHTAASLGRDVGVYVASMGPDYAVLSANAALDGHSRYPNSDLYQLANRVSYFMDFTGPSIAVDTACSGSGVALQLAVDALRAGTVSAALAGGVNLILHPARRIQYAQLGMLSRTGRCHPFGADADGMVTSEGVGAVLLRPLRDALADGDHVYGVIRAVGTNSDGRTNGFTVPSPQAQAELIERTLRRAGVDPAGIGYVEAHGTGTPLGDPIEIRGLGKAFGPGNGPATIPVGSVKGNIGHTEAAAALAGLTKVLLQLRHRTLVPSLHSARLNPDIDFDATPFRVQQDTTAWPAAPAGAPRRASLSSFGAGGVNVHLVVEEAPERPTPPPAPAEPELIVLSARDEDRLRDSCARLAAHLRAAGPHLGLRDVAFTLREGRETLTTRLALVVGGLDELAGRLERIAGHGGPLAEAVRGVDGALTGRADDDTRLGDVFDGTPAATEVLRTLAAHGERAKLARLWCQGARLDWADILPSRGGRRVSLPGYPFARTRHWLTVTEAPEPPAPADAETTLHVPDWTSATPAADDPAGATVTVVGGTAEWARTADHHVRDLTEVTPQPARRLVVVDRRGLDGPPGPLSRALDEAPDALRALARLGALTYVSVTRPDHDDPAAALASGFGRALEHEVPGFRPVRLEVDEDAPEPALTQVLSALRVPEGRLTGDGLLARVWRRAAESAAGAVPFRRGGHYVVTGGRGGVGRLLTAHLVERHGARVTWVSRSTAPPGSDAAVYEACADVSDPAALAAALAEARRVHGPVHGVVHAAGVLDDGPARSRTADQVRAVLAPKAVGCVVLDEATADDPLDFFVLMSSYVGTLGNAGQTSYCAANRFLDAYAERRARLVAAGKRSGTSVSIAWPLWRDGGMRMPDAVRRLTETTVGLVPIGTPAALTALEDALRLGRPRVLVGHGDQRRIGAALAPAPVAERRAPEPPGTDLRDLLREEAARLLKIPAAQLGDTAEFGDLGFNSMLFTDFANRLNDRLGLTLTPVAFYQHSTIGALTAALADTPVPAATEPRTLPAATPEPDGTMPPVAVIGMAGRLPGSPDLAAYWQHLIDGDDLVGPGPVARFGDPAPTGGFLDDVLAFDAEFFAVSPREASLMDPQQRLFLEAGWQAVENAAIRPSSLAGSRTGVFVGATLSDYADLLGRKGEDTAAHSITGHVQSVIANRLSYLLDLRGPSEVVDTACSSSLTALHRALAALAAGECDLALAGGVNALFNPRWFDSLGQAGMLSPTGRCWTFDERADGFVRGEGVGVVVLKPLDRALADGDPVRAVIRGSAVNHGGRAHSLTAPRPEAQAQVVTAALERAGTDPRGVSYVETHGTGTRLGDPIEIAGLTSAFERLGATADAPWCHLGAVKANIGHLESAAGIAALLKVVLAMEHRVLPPNPVGERANPHLRLDGGPFRVLREARPWRPVDAGGAPMPLRAGVSAFGFGGANAHVVVEEPPSVAVSAAPGAGRPSTLVLSAPDHTRLRAYATLLGDELRRRPDEFADLAHTSGVVQEPLAARLAVVAASPDEACAALDAYLAGRAAPGLVTEAAAPGSGESGDLARRWAGGEAVTWPADPGRRRVPFPARPFDHSTEYGPRTGSAEDGPRTRSTEDGPRARSVESGSRAHPAESSPRVDTVTPSAASLGNLRLLRPLWTPEALGQPERSPRTILVLAGAEAGAGLLEEVAGLTAPTVVVLREPSPVPLPCARTLEADLGDRDATLRVLREELTDHEPFDLVVDLVDTSAAPGAPSRHEGRLALLQELAARARRHPVTVVHPRPSAASRPADAGDAVLTAARVAGCVRAVGAEYAAVTAVTVAYDTLPAGMPGPLALAAAEYAAGTRDAEIRYTHGTREVRTTDAVPAVPPAAPGHLGTVPVTAHRPYLVTGGTGGLGLAAAELLVARGARRIALTGRRALPPRAQWAHATPDDWWGPCAAAVTRMEAAGAEVLVGHGTPGELPAFLDEVRARFGTPAGVLHCAGAVSPTPAFVHKPPHEFDTTWQPKGPALAALAGALGDDAPDFVVLYSSLSAWLPELAVGLSDYAAANAALDDYAAFAAVHASRRGTATRWLSLAWGSWSGIGMGEVVTPRYGELGFTALRPEDGLTLLDAALATTTADVTLAAVATVPADPPTDAPEAAPMEQQHDPVGLTERCAAHLTGVLADVTGLDRHRIAPDRPFADLGVDSILIASIVVRLEEITGTALDPSVVLEHPTVDRLARHLTVTYRDGLGRWAGDQPDTTAEAKPAAAPTPGREPSPTTAPLAVIGMAGRFPGAPDTAAFWELLRDGRSGVREVPRGRWDVASLYSPAYAPGMSISKWGGYLDGIEEFDPAYFGIPEDDAAHMDPLIRLFLEAAETAIADAGYRGEELNGRPVGVFVGSGTSTYGSRVTVPGRATATGLNQNFIAAHLAHLHDLRGPNLTVDTACSSSLSGLHLARQSLLLGECEMAIVGGADLLLDETPYLSLSAARALSPDGTCHVFDAAANGFVPGEGVGAVLVKPLDAALRDGDRVLAVIESTAMNNDGRTMGLTTPNPDAQQAVVREALLRAGADPASVSYVEAHGTGTMIGDPMELRSLTHVFGESTDERQFCAVGSVKSNVGHLLMAAGMAGLQKIVLSLQNRQLPPTLHCERPNPRFAFETSPFRVQDRLAPWQRRHGVRRAGLSAFGFGGTNCHVVLREAPDTDRTAVRTPLPAPVFQRRRYWLDRPGPADRPPTRPTRPLLLELEELI